MLILKYELCGMEKLQLFGSRKVEAFLAKRLQLKVATFRYQRLQLDMQLELQLFGDQKFAAFRYQKVATL